MRLTRSPKILTGATVQVISGIFMISAYGTHSYVPLPIVLTYLGLVVCAAMLLFVGMREEDRKRKTENLAHSMHSSESH
jgi:hypothetical protein